MGEVKKEVKLGGSGGTARESMPVICNGRVWRKLKQYRGLVPVEIVIRAWIKAFR